MKYCSNLTNRDLDWMDSNRFQCKLTGKPCVARTTEEVSTQPSCHWATDDSYNYDPEIARRCPSYGKKQS